MVCGETHIFAPTVARAHTAQRLLGGSFINGLRRNYNFAPTMPRAHPAPELLGGSFINGLQRNG
jgi:hypothetical protein